MEGKTLIVVAFSGLCFLPACFPRVYTLVEQAKTWAEAQSDCRGKYTDLASVDNQEEFDRLVATAQRYYDGHVWIGLYDDINSWRWSLEKEGYYSEEEAEFRMWKSDAPDNFMGYQNCAEMNADGLWNDLTCKDKKQSVCYNGSVETAASSSFIFVNESKTWHEAQSYCRERYIDLASVRNQAENDQIKEMTRHQRTWIGLYRDSWKWSDGSPTSFTKWNTTNNEPNGNGSAPCVLLHMGQFEERKCDEKLFFVCHIVPVRQQMVRVEVTKKDSPENLEDAAEAILQQFSQSLNDHGLSEDMKLTWRKQPDGRIFHLEEKEERKKISRTLK